MRRLSITLATAATSLPMLLTIAPAQASVTPSAAPPNVTSSIRCSGTRQPPSAFHPATDLLPGPGGSCGRGFQYAVTPTHGTTATYTFSNLDLLNSNVLEVYIPRGHATAKVDYKVIGCRGEVLSQSPTFDQNTAEGWVTVTNNQFGGCISKVILESGMASGGFDMAMDAIGFNETPPPAN